MHEEVENTQEEQIEQTDELVAERDELVDRLQRLQAEFENFRKRASREQQALVARAHERLVKELLPVLDDLGRALEAAEQHEEATLEDGVRLVHRQLTDVLAKEGLTEIETDGAFDPHVHEALLTQPSDAEEGSVIEVVQKGYRLGDFADEIHLNARGRERLSHDFAEWLAAYQTLNPGDRPARQPDAVTISGYP